MHRESLPQSQASGQGASFHVAARSLFSLPLPNGLGSARPVARAGGWGRPGPLTDRVFPGCSLLAAHATLITVHGPQRQRCQCLANVRSRAHNPKVTGSNPVPATLKAPVVSALPRAGDGGFCFARKGGRCRSSAHSVGSKGQGAQLWRREPGPAFRCGPECDDGLPAAIGAQALPVPVRHRSLSARYVDGLGSTPRGSR